MVKLLGTAHGNYPLYSHVKIRRESSLLVLSVMVIQDYNGKMTTFMLISQGGLSSKLIWSFLKYKTALVQFATLHSVATS